MTTKSSTITMTATELSALVANAVAQALAQSNAAPVKAAKAPKPKVVADASFTARVVAAIKADPKQTPYTNKQGVKGMTYKGGFAAVIIMSAIKKHGDKAEFALNTIKTAGKAYGITK